LRGDKAHVEAVAVGQPHEVHIEGLWLLYYPNSAYNYTHQITIEITVTYFNGTAYKQLVQPIDFTFGPDHNNSFEDAEEITFGTHQGYVDRDPNGDPVDYFKIYLHQGQKVRISAWNAPYPGELAPDVFVYNPEESLEGSWSLAQTTSQMVLSINQTGWWYIKVTITLAPNMLYALDISSVSG
jgi:hypothetical protein